MANDDDVLERRTIRTARPPAMGTIMNEASAGIVASGSSGMNTVVAENGKVRRLWQEGDPWTDDYFFGGGEIL